MCDCYFSCNVCFAADNLTVNDQLTGPHAAGVNSILPKEHGSPFFYLPIIRHSDDEVMDIVMEIYRVYIL